MPPVVTGSGVHFRGCEAVKGAGGRVFNDVMNCYEYTASMAFKNEIDMEEKTEVLGENPILAPLRARQNKKWLPLDRTWDSVDKDRRLTACVGNF